jgi:endonuclease YncB( thermonuclease family)
MLRLARALDAPVPALALGADSFTGKVVAVAYRDTIRVMHDGRAERVRLWGIDCPEKRQPFGTRARQSSGDLAFGKDVKVMVREVDRCGRTVGEVILPDGRSLNRQLVRAGAPFPSSLSLQSGPRRQGFASPRLRRALDRSGPP